MIGYLKKNKLHIYLLLVITFLVSLPILQGTVLPEEDWFRKGICVLLNLTTALISYGCFAVMFGNRLVGMAGSLLYTCCPMRCNALYVSGGREESLAWCFLPIVLLGMIRFYNDFADEVTITGVEKTKEKGSAWIPLSLGLVLLAVSSLTFFCIAVAVAALWFLLMGKKSFGKQSLICVGKTILATGILGGWFLLRPVLSMSDPVYVGGLIPENFRMTGLYFAQYFSLFSTKGSGMGAAVLLLVVWYLWSLFVKKFEDSLGKKILVLAGILLLLGSNLFPWDLLQNKNMLFSVVLALLRTPANWVAFGYTALIWIGCRMVQKLMQGTEIEFPKWELVLPDKMMVLIFALAASLPLMVSYHIVGEELLWYLMEAQELLGVSVDGIYGLFAFLVNAGTAVIAYVSFRKCSQDGPIGVLATGLYLLSPYRLYLLYTRSAVPEYMAILFVPLIVAGVCGLCRKEKSGLWNGIRLVVGLAGSMGCYGISFAAKVAGNTGAITPFDVRNVDSALLICILLWIGCRLADNTHSLTKGTKRTQLIYVMMIIALIFGTYRVNEILQNSGNLMFI